MKFLPELCCSKACCNLASKTRRWIVRTDGRRKRGPPFCSLIMSGSARHSPNCENQERRSGPRDDCGSSRYSQRAKRTRGKGLPGHGEATFETIHRARPRISLATTFEKRDDFDWIKKEREKKKELKVIERKRNNISIQRSTRVKSISSLDFVASRRRVPREPAPRSILKQFSHSHNFRE